MRIQNRKKSLRPLTGILFFILGDAWISEEAEISSPSPYGDFVFYTIPKSEALLDQESKSLRPLTGILFFILAFEDYDQEDDEPSLRPLTGILFFIRDAWIYGDAEVYGVSVPLRGFCFLY